MHAEFRATHFFPPGASSPATSSPIVSSPPWTVHFHFFRERCVNQEIDVSGFPCRPPTTISRISARTPAVIFFLGCGFQPGASATSRGSASHRSASAQCWILDDGMIRNLDDDHVAVGWSPPPLNPGSRHIMLPVQRQPGGRNTGPWACPPSAVSTTPSSGAGLDHFSISHHDAPVRESGLDELTATVVIASKTQDVGIEHPVHLLRRRPAYSASNASSGCAAGIRTRAARKSVS